MTIPTVVLYQAASLAIGVLAIVLGYRLFLAAGLHQASDASRGDDAAGRKVKEMVPSFIFTLFGIGIVGGTLLGGRPETGIDFTLNRLLDQEERAPSPDNINKLREYLVDNPREPREFEDRSLFRDQLLEMQRLNRELSASSADIKRSNDQLNQKIGEVEILIERLTVIDKKLDEMHTKDVNEPPAPDVDPSALLSNPGYLFQFNLFSKLYWPDEQKKE